MEENKKEIETQEMDKTADNSQFYNSITHLSERSLSSLARMGRNISHKTRRQLAKALLSTGPQEKASLDCKDVDEPAREKRKRLE